MTYDDTVNLSLISRTDWIYDSIHDDVRTAACVSESKFFVELSVCDHNTLCI